jgi:predicted nucleic acid-binding protein
VLANPAYGSAVSRPSDLVERLRQLSDIEGHQFWADSVSLRDPAIFDCSRVGHRQLTDVYLLGLAQKHGGVLATFDRTIPAVAVVGARRDLMEVVAPLPPD